MDKIIDGVDVSECKYYDDGTCCDKDVMSLSCENTDCIYKQLKRLQAENERLKKKLVGIDKDGKYYYIDDISVKYRQVLQEIRELIKKLDLSLGCAYGDYDCDNCSDINEKTVCKIKLQNIIIDKINEVIGAE